jgi:chaperonin GroES
MQDKIRPLSNRLLVKPIMGRTVTDTGLLIPLPKTTFTPDSKPTEQTTVGAVVSIGPGKYDKRGNRRSPDARIGDIVTFSDTCGRPVEWEGEKYLFIREDDIVGMLPAPTDVEVLYQKTQSEYIHG